MPSYSYRRTLRKVARGAPRVASSLNRAHQKREYYLGGYASGVRLTGLEQFYDYLEKSETLMRSDTWGKPSTFLLERLRTDFDVALEMTLSGHVSGAFEAMRDALEIELLLRDFTYRPDHAAEWMAADDRQRARRFSPAALRTRLALDNPEWADSDAADYRGHSRTLHVTPDGSPFSTKRSAAVSLFGVDMGFWDILNHARRLVVVLDALFEMRQLTPKPVPNPDRDLPDLKMAWASTLRMQNIFNALVRNELDTTERDALAAIDHLPFAFDSLDIKREERRPRRRSEDKIGGPTRR